eukprot:7885407-Alexandrium_andersonii.AAC.1
MVGWWHTAVMVMVRGEGRWEVGSGGAGGSSAWSSVESAETGRWWRSDGGGGVKGEVRRPQTAG